MLGKMLLHGLATAILIGSAAAVFAQTRDNGYLPAPAAAAPAAAAQISDRGDRPADERGYIRRDRDDRGERSGKSERHHERRDRHHDKDDD
jgi:hypothetical protein